MRENPQVITLIMVICVLPLREVRDVSNSVSTKLHFRCLGYYERKFYYYSFLLEKIIDLTATDHRKENLFLLAPLSHWLGNYAKKTKGISWEEAADSLMQTCAAEGLFNPNDIIGRGIWIIDGKGVTHYGDKVLIDGKEYAPKQITREIGGKKVYEKSESLHLGEPLPNADFTLIESLLSELNFQTQDAALFISGWIVCAMAAGALHWRPHGWITGPSGSGKSAVMKFITTLLGNCCEHYVGETTEAGIRQDLKHDCRAIVFDEAEPKNITAIQKISNVLNLLRQASSDDTGKIAKGTVSGKGMNFKIRSCGFMGSINAQLTEEADVNRFTVYEMAAPMEKTCFDDWMFRMENAFSKGFQAALHKHISENILTLAHNSKIFAGVLAARFKNNRAGDQYGTIIAGAYLLTSIKKVDKEIAADWVKDIIFPIEKNDNDKKGDHEELWNYLLQRMVAFDKVKESLTGAKSNLKMLRPVAELVDAAFGNYLPTDYCALDAQKTLANMGIKCVFEDNQQFVAIATNHSILTDLLARSRFSGVPWSPILRRIEGSKVSEQPYRFGIGAKNTKATLIPWHNSPATDLKKVAEKVADQVTDKAM